MNNRLYRDEQHKKLGGVCAGLAEYFNADIALVRVLFVLAVIFGGCGVLAYIVLWIVIPNKPFVFSSPDDAFFNQADAQPQPVIPAGKTITTGSIVGGIILISLGGYLLLDQYDIIPNLDFNTFWPIVMIVIGLALMLGFWKRKPEPVNANTWDNNNTPDNTSSTDNSQTI